MLNRKLLLATLFLLFSSFYLLADENTDQAWQALTSKDYNKAKTFAQKCIEISEVAALQQQKDLNNFKTQNKENFKAFSMGSISTVEDKDVPGVSNVLANKELNDVATAYFIEAETLIVEGKINEAKQYYQVIINNYKDAYCWDPKGWYWKVSDVAQDKLNTLGTKYDYGDYRSETLTVKAWNSLKEKDYKGIELYTNKCLYLYENKAKKMQANTSGMPNKGQESLNWALNDIATCYFILGERYLLEGKNDLAKQMYQKATGFGFAVCWDPKGWYWKISDVAQDRTETMGTKYNYEDYKSVTLTTKAWLSLKEKDKKGVELYTKKCIYLYENEARDMQSKMKSFAQKGEESAKWALNDVATCYFILGEIYLKQGEDELAKQMYKKAMECGFALCFDPKGWYWKVADVVQDKLNNYGTPYDYEDYRSVTLTNKAWACLDKKDFKGAELYAKKCVYLFSDKAKEMQSQLTEYAKSSFIPYYWALNDVATCYFILGEAYRQQGDIIKAKSMYWEVANNYAYAQCWDPRGWYWKVAKISREKLNTLP